MSALLEKPVLILNANYMPLQVCNVKEAMTLVCKGTAHVQEHSASLFLRSQRQKWPLPSVIRLLSYRKEAKAKKNVSRKNILIRDRHTCQYCNAELPGQKLTLDHVMPKSRGGGKSFENLVASCFSCNNKKQNRTPEEAGMPLAKPPRKFGIHNRHKAMSLQDPLWQQYLFF